MANHFSILAWETDEQYEKASSMTVKDELPRLIGAQYAPGEEWRNNSRKNEETEPKWKHSQLWIWLVMEVKLDAVKNNIA